MNITYSNFNFIHYMPDDDNFYHVTCKNVLQGLDDSNYDHEFFYHHFDDSANYYVTCKLLSRHLILHMLNREIFGMDLNMNNFKQKESPLLSLNQKLNLEQNLKQFLPSYFTQNNVQKETNSFHEYFTQNNIQKEMNSFHELNSTNDNQNDINNNLPHQNGIGPQQRQHIPERETRQDYNSQFHGNIGSNVVVISTTDSQDSQNNFNSNNDSLYQRQNVDFYQGSHSHNNFSLPKENTSEYSFFYKAWNDFQIYHITYREISFEIISCLLKNHVQLNNLHVFCDQQPDKKIYLVTCEIVSYTYIICFLNKFNYGIEPSLNEQQRQENLYFSNEHKENLEFHLKQDLNNYLPIK